MRFLDRLERRYRRFGISNLMIYITATMLAVYLLQSILRAPIYSLLSFSRDAILQGQVWRVLTFIFLPPGTGSPFFLLISLYFYYFVGNSLESQWGSFRFTVYYLFGVVGAVVAGFITGGTANFYLNMSLFFAFAQLFPENQVLLFFIIPVKVKYLAYLNWGVFAIGFITGNFVSRVTILFSLINFFIFFGPDIWRRLKNWKRYSKSRRDFRRQRDQNRDMWG